MESLIPTNINFTEFTKKITISSFIFSIFLSYVLSFIVSRFYIKHSNTFSNPESLSGVLSPLSITTTIVISVVKSSLALSLGLVGALSIVRFRTPIKEPEELSYIFLSIAIGLASGADQYLAAIIGTVLFLLGIYISNLQKKRKLNSTALRLTIKNFNQSEIGKLITTISSESRQIDFNNLIIENQNNSNKSSITLLIKVDSFKNIELISQKIKHLFKDSFISIVDTNNF